MESQAGVDSAGKEVSYQNVRVWGLKRTEKSTFTFHFVKLEITFLES